MTISSNLFSFLIEIQKFWIQLPSERKQIISPVNKALNIHVHVLHAPRVNEAGEPLIHVSPSANMKCCIRLVKIHKLQH